MSQLIRAMRSLASTAAISAEWSGRRDADVRSTRTTTTDTDRGPVIPRRLCRRPTTTTAWSRVTATSSRRRWGQTCSHPILIDVETEASHWYSPTDKEIAETADKIAFAAANMGLTLPPNYGR